MANRIITGQNTPTSPDATQGPDASDTLENKLTQLRSLLNCCYGDEQELFEAIGARHRGNIMWIAADLLAEAIELSQTLLKRLRALDGLET
ncbi:hypothetical protein [Variovorax sp. GB1P17]|uniref:hypothetical protein n=1 Tax=Variovorax sp. GB1P17 TaxID=3443740 RepID=UPI003F448695